MTELERMIHEAVDKAFKDYMHHQAIDRVNSVSPKTLDRMAKYEELWDEAIVKALENMKKDSNQ